MKKMFLMVAALVTLGVASQAATLSIGCTQAAGSIGAGTATLVCPGFQVAPGVLGTINGISFVYAPDYTFNVLTPNGNESITYSIDAPDTEFDAVGLGFTRDVTPTPIFSGLQAGADYSMFQPGFNVTFTFSTPAGSTVTAATFDGAFTVDYTLPQSGVPEPTTMALFGSALVGLAGMLRRRK
jgi:hypothetical protein